MSSQDGGEPPPPPSPSASFSKLVTACTKKATQGEPSSFVRRLEDIPEINLPPEQPMKVAISLSERGLVGQFMGLWPSTRTTDNWIQRNWRPLIKNSVTCYAVGRGYFIFEFISQEDRDLIFRNGPYFMGAQGLYLNRWTPNFDPASEVPKDVPVWVRLPNLPIHCWNSSSLQAIGNGLGHYIDKADPKDQYSCARICVEVDLEVGLPEAVKLKVGEWHHLQKLDYEQLPFKCRGCHEYGHFQRNCPKRPCKRKKGRRVGSNPGKEERNPTAHEETTQRRLKAIQGSRTRQTVSKSWEMKVKQHPQATPAKVKKEEAPKTRKSKEPQKQQKVRRMGGFKAPRKERSLPQGMERIKATKRERSRQGVKQRGQVKLGTLQSDLAEGGSPKRRKGKRKRTRTFLKELSQPSSK
jgi:hypothetical protein